ncbi:MULTISPECIES: DUF1569 domain-containing protein [unclassified Pseudomonas]|uniref:DUF1569 domain-containing protein n=1 Tax=unclassified Pseudomonas TaxID=196821 RepID=UPI00244B5D49|nr:MULTISPECIES: DUF1569 domain-containing protein [unclassified Pseudomonas]MDG9930320.1 DUF1569 domain-containing protein [Pseudomonas sp. GD04042]MDH0485871.1 DUF1569 domain-containing protein [Pseudomonas sp. GD04015]MDH0605758.1 DUF1569 domain-containing protein [Pseudomonas sp. GD03869]
MQRRTLLKGAAVGGVVALGAGFWALPTGAAPAALSLDGARQVLEGLKGHALVSVQGWTPTEVFNHCAQSIEYSLDGYPQLKPGWFRHSVGPAAFAVFSARGAMRHPLTEAIPGAAPLAEPASQEAALLRLQLAFERFASHEGKLQPHFAYGVLDHEEYAQAHVMHLYNHLSLIRPA